MRRVLFIEMLIIFAFVAFLFFAHISDGRDIYVDGSYVYSNGNGTVDHPYQTIQHAIDLAESGDTIYVFPGTYNETLLINKKLTLQGLDKVNTTISKNDRYRYMIEITADYVTLEDFNITDPNGGCRVALIYVTSNVVTIQGNTINNSKNAWAIYLDSSNDNTIGSNDVSGCKGIYASSSVNNVFSNNKIDNCSRYAIELRNVKNTIVYGNTLEKSQSGVYADGCSNLNITNNTIGNNALDGISINQGSGNVILNNVIENNPNAIDIDSSSSKILSNGIKENEIGILLGGYGSTVYNNTIERSTSYGVYTDVGSSNNVIYGNHFSLNSQNALERGSNQWDNGFIGNYWSDYKNVDRNNDGLGDYPYYIPGGGVDNYPTGSFLKPPDTPSDPSPKDGASNVGLTPTLSVKVSDPDSNSLTVYFYRASDDKLIAERHGVKSGSRASCTFNIGYNTLMAWYVVVNDSKLETTSDIWVFNTVPIPPKNNKPIADPGGPYTGDVEEPLQFNGSGSHDPDGSIAFYRWNFGDGSGEILEKNPMHTYDKAGTYNVTLTVVDNNGTSDTAITTATIGKAPPNKVPVADVGGPYTATVNKQILFDGSHSYDPDGEIVEYRWNFGDDSTGTGQTCTHVYKKSNSYTVTLTVIDNGGKSDSSSSIVVVKEEKKTPGFEFVVALFAVIIVFIGYRFARR